MNQSEFNVLNFPMAMQEQPKRTEAQPACHLCVKGFPIEEGEHYGTQKLGMIPTTRCTKKEESK